MALRKAIDRLRTRARDARRAADMAVLAESDETEPERIADNRLRLIFTCCHPALDPKSRVALTLRTLGGQTTPEIATAFLESNTAMGTRRGRFKSKRLSLRVMSLAQPPNGRRFWRFMGVCNILHGRPSLR